MPWSSARAGVLVGDRLLGCATGGVPDVDASGRCGRLDPGRGVDEVAGDHPLALGADRDCRLSREDTGAGAQALGADLVTQSRNRRYQIERGAHGALGVASVVTGVPETAITASPMNFSTVPPYSSISRRQVSK